MASEEAVHLLSDAARSPGPSPNAPGARKGAPDSWSGGLLSLPLSVRRGVEIGALAMTDQGVVSGTSILTSIIVARGCGQEAFGVFVLGMSIVLLVLELQGALISTPYLVNSPPLSGEPARRYGGSALLHQLALAAAVGCCLALGTLVLTSWDARMTVVGWALALGVPFIILRDFLRRHCFARRKYGSAFRMDLGVGFLQLGLVGALAAASWLSASRSLAIVAAASGVGAVIWLRANRADFAPRLRDAIVDARLHWTVGRWVFASGVLWAAAAQLYPWLLAVLRGAADVGAWGSAMGICAVLNVPFLAGQNVLGPRIARARAARDVSGFCVFVLRTSGGFAVVLLSSALPLLLFGGRLLGLLYGRPYAVYGSVVSLLALSMALLAASFTVSRGLFCLERADLDFLVNLVPFAVLLTVGPVLVRGRGVLGAAVTVLLAYAVATGLRVVALLFAASRAVDAHSS